MAYMRLMQRSASMNCNMEVAIFYPLPDYKEKTVEQIKAEKKRVLYLLHDRGELFLQWPLQSNLYSWAMAREIIVVMPTVRDFFSARLSTVGDVFAYISRELPEYMQTILPISGQRENNLIAGVGMGGYYAVKVAAAYPERFKAAGAFTSLLDVKDYLKNCQEGSPEHIKSEEFVNSPNDVPGVLQRQKSSGARLPGLYLQCSCNAEEWKHNLRMCDWLKHAGIDFEWSQEESLEKGIQYFVDKNLGGNDGKSTNL